MTGLCPYFRRAIGSGPSLQEIFPVASRTEYRNYDGSGAITTEYAYTWHSGTLQVEQLTTALPAVPVEQNGPGGDGATTVQYFDAAGNLTWTKDELGFLTHYEYASLSNRLLRTIADADTDLTDDEPAGWTTPAGGGRHLVTDYSYLCMCQLGGGDFLGCVGNFSKRGVGWSSFSQMSMAA